MCHSFAARPTNTGSPIIGSGVSPFLPVRTPSTTLSAIPRVFVFLLRFVPFVAYVAIYFLVLQFLPLPPAARKLLLWAMMGIPGIWWVDLQIDGVKRGHLSQQPASRVPHPGSVIAASFTSPVDALYLAAVFDPIFTVSYPGARKVRRVSLFRAILQALSPLQLALPSGKANRDNSITDVRALISTHPDRIIVVFPECGTTNGKGVLPFSPSLLATPSSANIFPVSLRYTPSDITTPLPGAWATFLWKLLSRPTHCVRVRIAESMSNTTGETLAQKTSTSANGTTQEQSSLTTEEQHVLDHVAESLARLGRNKRVGLTLKDKSAFVEAWRAPKKTR